MDGDFIISRESERCCVWMKTIERITDFIKSVIYYPKMKKYFDDRDMSNCNIWKNEKFASIKYAWWHCHVGKLK